MNTALLLLMGQYVLKASMSSAEHKDLPHLGPNGSFPIDADHVKAAWDLAGNAADPDAMRHKIIAWAEGHGATDRLPASALAWAKEHGAHVTPAKKAGDDDQGEGGEVEVQKASSSMLITKAWPAANGDLNIEGWVSTEDSDLEKDIVPPECFKASIGEYMARRAPLSSEHNTRSYPIGHMQRAALVRDGLIFQEASHPTDAPAFQHFPNIGTGVFARGVITDPTAASQVQKGNIGGFSWIGQVTQHQRLPNGGRRFVTVNPLREMTIAAYPINGKATLVAASSMKES